MNRFADYYEARRIITDIVREDLLGPVFKEEVINEPPTSYYIMGKLYPLSEQTIEYDENNISTDLENLDEVVTLSSTNSREPSAMGITFTIKRGISAFNVDCGYALYKPYSLEKAIENEKDISNYKQQIDNSNSEEKSRMKFWKRNEYRYSFRISVSENSSYEIDTDVFLKSFIHMETESAEKIISVVLTNERNMGRYTRDVTAANTLMQPYIRISGIDNSCIFSEISKQVKLVVSDELQGLDMLYLDKKCFAQGHGCSVTWDRINNEPEYIESDYMPEYAVKQTKAVVMNENPVFSIQYIFRSDRDEVIHHLSNFINTYRSWIGEQKLLSESPQYAAYKDNANQNIKNCEKVCERIEQSISILAEEDADTNLAWKAFVLANEAMYMQRYQSLAKKAEENKGKLLINPDEIVWYPFQLAFILLEIKSFVDPECDDREIVDLLWFPTGGGKTEAYLGISAFEIFYRRLSSPDKCDGLTVIMRYTLRLLTVQQFERASLLICACEILRKRYNIPGDEISIGLWVGNSFTPGTLDDAGNTLLKLKESGKCGRDDINPCQIKICPWCGNKLYPRNYNIKMADYRMEIICRNEKCAYSNIPLPIRLIDEEIYHNKPTFLVATVDKFAQIAIQEKASSLFSLGTGNLPPELIIQDELHLISGPLGTITGIYEASILGICADLGRKVKVIASTATIRNASSQINSLYGRNYCQFPAPGISSDNSFFSMTAASDEKPDRLYAGIMGVGTTFTTTLIRLYAAWLFASRYLVDLGYDERIIDNYWTLTGYFNSIRELGATQTQIVDDIQSRYKFLKGNKFKKKYSDFSGNERYEYSVELTSRMSNDEISEIIQEKLKMPYTSSNSSEVYDFVLASNMISVGVDVSRLGTMAVAGQSKTNAEYIQATSRVGRSNPGLVFTVYNGVRSRDRSHYEQFTKYHQSLYRYVEATSLTPFSDRARDRALQALFVILCRYYCPELLADNSAGNFNLDLEAVNRVKRYIYRYVKCVDEREADNVLSELKAIEKEWCSRIRGNVLWYRKKNANSLLRPDIEEDRFRIMNSMRSVENESGIYLIGGRI